MACFAGDGCFMMFGQEIATAIQYDLPILIFVINNGTYGTIRMHQEKNYPDRVSGTDLVNPDFAAFARSFGAFGATVTRTEDFPAALEAALAQRHHGADRIAGRRREHHRRHLADQVPRDGLREGAERGVTGAILRTLTVRSKLLQRNRKTRFRCLRVFSALLN